MKQWIYNLINSKAISEHCRKINHQFNTEEIAVLIYRNKSMSIYDKMVAYTELIKNYEDMEVAERLNCKHYDSVKDLIKKEIQRLQTLDGELQQNEDDTIYTYTPYYASTSKYEYSEFDNTYRTFTEVCNAVEEEITIYNDISKYIISKRILSQRSYIITAENNNIYLEHVFNYDSWEYFNGKLKRYERLLKSISSLMKNEINIELF